MNNCRMLNVVVSVILCSCANFSPGVIAITTSGPLEWKGVISKSTPYGKSMTSLTNIEPLGKLNSYQKQVVENSKMIFLMKRDGSDLIPWPHAIPIGSSVLVTASLGKANIPNSTGVMIPHQVLVVQNIE